MKRMRPSRIIMTVLAVFAAGVLFVTYGTVLPAAPFTSIQLDNPTIVDSDGEFTVVTDTESRRALILNADGNLTGVVSCTTADSPIDAITDARVVNGTVYLSGVRFEPDSDTIQQERVVMYDKGGNFQGVIYEKQGTNSVTPAIKSLSDAADGVVVAYEVLGSLNNTEESDEDTLNAKGADGLVELFGITFEYVNANETKEVFAVSTGDVPLHDAALAINDSLFYSTLSVRGVLDDGKSDYAIQMYDKRVFTSIDIDDKGTLYACDDGTGALCAIPLGSTSIRTLIPDGGFQNVRENKGVIGLCNTETNKVTLCDTSGDVKCEFTEVSPSIGFSLRMLLVWASALYLAALALTFAVHKVRNLVKEGKTEGIGPMLLSIAVVTAIAVAVGNLSFSSYQKSLELRANEINVYGDFLKGTASDLSDAMQRIGDRNALRGTDDELADASLNLYEAIRPVFMLVYLSNRNDIGMYFNLYGKDDQGIFYLYGSGADYIMGTSARISDDGALQRAFDASFDLEDRLLKGRTLRDTTQCRLVQIPSTDGKEVVGVIEIGSKMRSFESSLTGDLAQRILALLVMVLVVYLAYSELRACGRCLFRYRQYQREGAIEAVAVLTRPFTLAITMLSSIDSVMTVLIARDLLAKTDMGASSPLLGLPAVMLGIGLIIGQGLYAFGGSRVGLRRLVAGGAFAMLLCACLTGVAVAYGGFWLYCAAKLAMSVPFGLLYTLGYSLPRLARSDEVRTVATGGVKRTDTSAAALGTVLGGYAAQALGNGCVYALVAVACLPVILMALNLLPRGIRPLEALAQPQHKKGLVRDFIKKPTTLAIAFFVVLPATVAAGYASFLFPIFSADLGMSKSDINNIFVLGQLVVYVCIGSIERVEERYGKWRVSTAAIALLGAVFLLFSVNTTLAWSIAVIALVGLLCKSADGWKAMWLKAADESEVPAGRATGAMFATRSLALVAQPAILSSLLGATDSIAVIVIGALCLICAGLFFLATRNSIRPVWQGAQEPLQ